MNNKTLFKKAHKIARQTVAEVGNYQIAFKLALIDLRLQPTTTQKIKAVVCNLPEVFSLLVLCTLFTVIGGGFGFMLSYHGILNELPIMYLSGSALIAAMVVCVYQVVTMETQSFIYNYKQDLKV